ncbi:hypothetical protein GCM10011611_36260 [Aliidongia dinghuensis]|uniref:Porin n=1 Tax=Aliidongia dinghuensis TaxID=1867774 RepID=A0A8J3E4G8_9PROT|nr:hypothetical protein [Aliidongia dinghuensis]GGF26997.1 hypothetical protein GCM10011611_36260 [Aliidongia dinghuensis]
MTEQVQSLQAQLKAAQAAPPALPGTPVTQNPGNLPGISVVPPYTLLAPGPPDAVPKVAAAPVSSGGDRLKLSVSGQVDRMEIYGNDGRSSTVRNVDNNISSSRLRFVAEGRINQNTSAGANFEAQMTPNSSSNTSLTQDSPSSVTNFTPTGGTTASNTGGTFTARQVEVYLQNKQWGGLRLGFGSTASYQVPENDLSGTFIATYPNVADIDGGFAFRQRGAALIPGTTKGTFINSPANAFGPAVGTVYNFMDGLVRDDRIRYDTPVWNGLQLSASLVDGGAFDVALRYAGTWEGAKFAAAFGFADADGRNHAAPSNPYGYAAGLTTPGTGPLQATTIADASANESKQYSGSASVLLPSGFNLTIAGGQRDVKYTDPLGKPITPVYYYGKLGYLTKFWDFGSSAFAVDFLQNDELNFAGDTARSYGIAFEQTIDDAGLELFVAGHHETLSRSFASYNAINIVTAGARVRF